MGGRAPPSAASRQATSTPPTSPFRSTTCTARTLALRAMPKRGDWKRPDRRRMHAIRDRLRAEYGRPVLRPHRKPVDELILTVLSQNTNDRNRDVAYARLRERFSSWDRV